jgi:UDP-N-acetylmuramoyl-tripeptide--D-alanyl-D-alanine ligase
MVKVTGGRLLSGDPGSEICLERISTDSRTIRPGGFFLPIKGKNFDGERFVARALGKGAAGSFITSRGLKAVPRKKIIIRVKDTATALQRLAHAHRMKFGIPVIGVTGSNGKTSTKDMICEALSSRFKVLKSEGTKNNHLGVPQTLLKLKKRHDICVLEMGMNHKGEIRLLADIARPTMAVITNIGPSHLKFLKNLDGVFEAKKEITEFLPKGGTLIINGDDRYLSLIKSRRLRIERFGFDERNDLRASLTGYVAGRIEFIVNDRTRFVLNLIGTHNVYNALAAIAVARRFALGFDAIRKGLAGYRPGRMRLNMKKIGGITVINDAYNSNPLSMECALQAIKYIPAGAKWIVSADMLELGEREGEFHRIVGESVARSGFDGLITFGRLSRHTHSSAIENGMKRQNIWHCSSRGEVVDRLRSLARPGDAVLVKGSRAMKMEEVVEGLKGAK